MQFSKELIGFTTPMLILGLLRDEASYGYGMIKSIRELSEGELQWAEGSLYPVLKKMQSIGLIRSKGKISKSGKLRHYYFITSRGLDLLDQKRREWQFMDGIVKKLMSNSL